LSSETETTCESYEDCETGFCVTDSDVGYNYCAPCYDPSATGAGDGLVERTTSYCVDPTYTSVSPSTYNQVGCEFGGPNDGTCYFTFEEDSSDSELTGFAIFMIILAGVVSMLVAFLLGCCCGKKSATKDEMDTTKGEALYNANDK
jgi:hypothetical protein